MSNSVTHERIDELIAASEEHTAMVAQLEQQVDQGAGGGSFDTGDLPTGDEIAAELERFLRGEQS